MRLLNLFSAILLLSYACNVGANDEEKGPSESIHDRTADPSESSIFKAMEKFEAIATSAGRQHDEGILPTENTDAFYEKMVEILTDIIESVKNSNNANTFLKHKGLDRIVAPNIIDIDDELKANILILLKILFDVSPSTTTALIPTSIVDGVLEVFEKDNLALKAHALDVLCLWLPGNPIVQSRVMKIKGLVPFYEQIPALDSSGVRNLLDLFNKVLIEHLQIREVVEKKKVQSEREIVYQRMGLLDRMSTSLVCDGLLNIFTTSWTYNTKDNNLIITVFDLLKNVKEFCLRIFRGKTKAINLFNALQQHLKDSKNIEHFGANNVNIDEIIAIIDDYVEKVKLLPKDEL